MFVVALAMPKSAILTLPSRGDHQVLGLQVAVHDPVLLRLGQAGEQPLEHARDLRQVIWPTYGRSDPRSTYSIAMYGVPSCSK